VKPCQVREGVTEPIPNSGMILEIYNQEIEMMNSTSDPAARVGHGRLFQREMYSEITLKFQEVL
jgi:hypothetical protein